ncbi:hypothetical protein RFI_29865 [Reticulomyxa filosa]|uniref:Uncharacterized protein n=1 Tax=Reticulomyxa filosa TaxID=46433 RepID=X6M290_RETFI|nr:hypothetical protein RFI_29865 [Reticulomyxa filosa]|eukprot:ETO07527.1 hypothetical protein RFI_29865 [Reticulomyxa filosa]
MGFGTSLLTIKELLNQWNNNNITRFFLITLPTNIDDDDEINELPIEVGQYRSVVHNMFFLVSRKQYTYIYHVAPRSIQVCKIHCSVDTVGNLKPIKKTDYFGRDSKKKGKHIKMIITATEELTIWRIYNPDVINVRDSASLVEINAHSFLVFVRDEKVMSPVNKDNDKPVGGMQHDEDQGQYPTELRALIRLCGDVMEEEELKRQFEENNGNVHAIIEKIVSTLMTQKVSLHSIQKRKLISIWFYI